MATNREYEDGSYLSINVDDAAFPGDTCDSGDPVLVGALPGVCVVSQGDGGNDPDNATIHFGGVYRLNVTGAVTEIGQPVYITSAGALNRTTSNDLFGFALATKGASAAVIPVKVAAYSNNVASS